MVKMVLMSTITTIGLLEIQIGDIGDGTEGTPSESCSCYILESDSQTATRTGETVCWQG